MSNSENKSEAKPTLSDLFMSWLYYMLAHAKVIAWRFFAISMLVVLYTNILSKGITIAFPDMGEKLSKSGLLAFTANYVETVNIRIAHAFAVLFMAVVFIVWELLLRMICGDVSFFDRFAKPDAAKRLMTAIGVVVLIIDSWFYYSGLTQSTWGQQSAVSMKAVLSTLGFIAINAAATLISIFLSPARKPQPKETKHV